MASRFLVSTTHHLLAIDVETHEFWQVHSGSGLYYGLAKDDDGLLYAACRKTIACQKTIAYRKAIVSPGDETVQAAEVGSILVLDRGFRVVREIQAPFPLRDVHGISCFDGRLWVTCSFDNMVAICDLTTGDWSRWFPAPGPADDGRDVHHFNTVRRVGSKICLIAHRFGPSELLFYDLATLQLTSTVSIGAESHGVFLFDDAIATCSSRDGCLVNTTGKRLRTGNFPRGIATTSEGALLGLSVLSGPAQCASQNGILRWYTPDWRFQADYVLPRVGMVLDIVELAEQEHDWQALEYWPHAEITSGTYNRQAPGNRYAPNSFAACAPRNALEWHATEETHCWTAAERATLSILVNPDETQLCVEIESLFPGPYDAEIRLDEALLGVARFSMPGTQQHKFRIPTGVAGSALLSFSVPHLWRPAERIPGSRDVRLLGLAVRGATVDL